MVVKYKVEGTIEVDLNDDEIEEIESHKSETMKKAYLEQLYILRDWERFAGNMKAKGELHGSPLAIFLEDIPTTEKEELNKSMEEIGKRKQRHQNKCIS